MSHELRSPLTTFNASIEVLRNARDEMPERAQLALDLLQLRHRAVHPARRGPARDLPLRRRRGPPRDRRRSPSSRRSAWRSARCRSTPIPVEADPSARGPSSSCCDKRRLVRILANFIDNAAKYADGATAVLVERAVVAADPDATIAGEAPTSRRPIRITVEDEGPGVPEADRERIFDRFNRGEQGGSRGTDLGVGPRPRAGRRARPAPGRRGVGRGPHRRRSAASRFVLELPIVEPSPPTGGRGLPRRGHVRAHGAPRSRERRGPVTRLDPGRRAPCASPSSAPSRCVAPACGIPLDDHAPGDVARRRRTHAPSRRRRRGGDTTAYVYFVKDDRLVDRRPATCPNRSVERGPRRAVQRPDRRPRPTNGLISQIPAGTVVQRVVVRRGHRARVDLSKEMSRTSSAGQPQAIGQIVMTATELDPASTVEVRVGGQTLKVSSPTRGDVDRRCPTATSRPAPHRRPARQRRPRRSTPPATWHGGGAA